MYLSANAFGQQESLNSQIPAPADTLQTTLPWVPPKPHGWAGIYDYTLRSSRSLGGGGSLLTSSTLGHAVDSQTQSHVLGIRYELSNKWAFRIMGSALDNKYTMEKDSVQRQVFVQGVGDTKVQGIYQIYEDSTHRFEISAGSTVPTGATDLSGPDGQALSPRMQLGSGTFDFVPSASLVFLKNKWQVGNRLEAIVHNGKNSSGFTVGDTFSDSLSANYELFKFLRPSIEVSLRNKQRLATDHPRQNTTSSSHTLDARNPLPAPPSLTDSSMAGPGWSYDGSVALRSVIPMTQTFPVRAYVEAGIPLFQGGQRPDTGMKASWFAGSSIVSNF